MSKQDTLLIQQIMPDPLKNLLETARVHPVKPIEIPLIWPVHTKAVPDVQDKSAPGYI